MKFTYDWLKDYLDTDAAPMDIAAALTRIGLEVDDIVTAPAPIAARILECEDIPGTHLHKLLVDDGAGTPRNVVCGAPNVRVGLVSALALPGCKIGGIEIKAGKIRGFESNGMMCSAKELGISDDHDGIIELDEKSETVGQPILQITNHKSQITTFEAGITPNRPDYLAVCGISHDLAAAGMGKFIHKYDNYVGEFKDSARNARIENYAACPVYYFCEINDIKISPSSPRIANRLAAIGINPKNAAIDATNYVCYDIGQPMHCFDADQVNGDIIIRNAKPGEKFTDLFGAEHELAATDLVIADSDGILALAGIVGGGRGMTTDDTKNIILESAYFEPVGIRKTAKRLGLSTDSSYRYERGIDPTITFHGIMQSAKIITDACGGDVAVPFRDWDKTNPKLRFMGENPENYSDRIEWLKVLDPRRIPYTPALFKHKTGIDLSSEKQKEILENLGFGVEIDGDEWTIIPTPARVDVEIPENIVSDLIRIYGYDKIESKEQLVASKNNTDVIYSINDALKTYLCTLGLYESITYGFGDSEKEKLLSDRPNIAVLNPIVANLNTVRNGLVQNMLDVIAFNDRFRRTNLNLFELGTVFDGDMPGQQHDQLIIARTGIAGSNMGAKHGRAIEIYDVRRDLLDLLDGGDVENDPAPQKWANPYRAGRIVKNGTVAAQFGELHPLIAKHFGVKTNVVLGIVDDIKILQEHTACHASRITHHASRNDFPEFPLITRDFAFIVDNGINPSDIVSAILGANEIVYETNVFDVFDLGDGKKSVAFEIVLQPVANMTDADLLDLQNEIIRNTECKFNAKIRDK
ncbi:MAG: phenylalanine--tRNA ligase subunit beta [Rickettsiales bacterium]|jgi:phenylalanyl-tRNA synthetase beta chain|nr:phenylalanine--tRNA ligase subunit beta [Rickettsiales bacterium]